MAPGVAACLLSVAFVSCSPVRTVQNWTEYRFGNVLSFRAPFALERTGERGIDSNVAGWQGEGIAITIDYGLFSDPLNRYDDRSDYESVTEPVNGRTARIISFAESDGGWFVGVHVPELTTQDGRAARLTMVVRGPPDTGRDTLVRIVRSITFSGSDAGSSADT